MKRSESLSLEVLVSLVSLESLEALVSLESDGIEPPSRSLAKLLSPGLRFAVKLRPRSGAKLGTRKLRVKSFFGR